MKVLKSAEDLRIEKIVEILLSLLISSEEAIVAVTVLARVDSYEVSYPLALEQSLNYDIALLVA